MATAGKTIASRWDAIDLEPARRVLRAALVGGARAVADADRVCVLDGGRIVESGPHDALMSQGGLYKRLMERQFVAA